jgi:hypothetical protein
MNARRGGPIRQLVATLLLALVYTDLGDASCDPLAPVPQSGAPALTTPAGTGPNDEACQDVCVPDCFCCARSLVAGHVHAPPAVPAAPFDVPPDEHSVPGTRAVLDHPPAA